MQTQKILSEWLRLSQLYVEKSFNTSNKFEAISINQEAETEEEFLQNSNEFIPVKLSTIQQVVTGTEKLALFLRTRTSNKNSLNSTVPSLSSQMTGEEQSNVIIELVSNK